MTDAVLLRQGWAHLAESSALIPGTNVSSRYFHKKMPIWRGVQVKSKRTNSEGIQSVNPTSCGRISGKPQALVFCGTTSTAGTLPSSFLLTINDLRVRCGTKWYGVVKTVKVVGAES
jgi:hypothetical protein